MRRLNTQRAGSTFRSFATKVVAEAVKTTVTALGAAILASQTVAPLLGVVAKELVSTLLSHASEIEGKLDRLLKEPLLSGLRLLEQGLRHGRDSENEDRAADTVLDQAHAALTRAWALVSDSREDSTFVRALDCIALATHRSHKGLAVSGIDEVQTDLNLLGLRVLRLESVAEELVQDSQRIDKFLDLESWRDKPFGYMEQRLVGRHIRGVAASARADAEAAREGLTMMEELVRVAQLIVESQTCAVQN
jgi:hypothetical protein